MNYIELDHQENPMFAMAYVQRESRQELDFLLSLEFNQFFTAVG